MGVCLVLKKEIKEVGYYAVIPATVRYSDIPPNAKLLYGEISALCNKEGFCWATDAYFAALYKVKRQTVNGWISTLAKNGCIHIKTITNEAGLRKRKIHLECREKVTGVSQKDDRGCHKKVTYNNTVNNTYNISNVEIQSIYDLYIDSFKSNPKQFKLTPIRRQKIKKRIKDCGREMLEKAITNTAHSDFHTGDNDRSWKANLDFIIKSYEQVERLANMEVVKGKDVEEYEIDWSKI